MSVNHLWQPSNARSWPVKDPGDTLDYVFDITPALTANPGDGISGLNVTITPDQPGDLGLASSSVDGARAVMWLTGGQAGVTYTVTVVITTAGGRTLARSIALPVVALATVPAPAAALMTPAGQPLTDPTGSPLTTL
ncbi:MAG: hypothetical protein B7Z80_12830 [Rhodospirillales bacterium 20-64-7]|nr:MAG: hypothetical protein B7Z80_12830 [Rhodospirillales bacterium 20-64-7]